MLELLKKVTEEAISLLGTDEVLPTATGDFWIFKDNKVIAKAYNLDDNDYMIFLLDDVESDTETIIAHMEIEAELDRDEEEYTAFFEELTNNLNAE